MAAVVPKTLAYAVVISAVLQICSAAKVEFPQTTSFSLALRVEKTQWPEAQSDWQKLLKFAKENKMNANTIMLVRTASEKIDKTLIEFEKIKKDREAFEKKEKEKAAGPAPPAIFTTVAGHSPDFNTQVGVKPLKSSGSKRKNVMRYRASEVPNLLKKGKIDLTKPFLVTDGVNGLEDLRQKWTALKMIHNYTDVRVRYLSPVKAKERRSFDKQQQNPNEEMEYVMLSLEKYFVNCFNLRGKPDFRKMGGAQTEHCEMTVPASQMDPKMSEYELEALKGSLGGFKALESGRIAFAENAAEFQSLVHENIDIKRHLQQSSSHSFVFGSSGSGEQLRQEGHSFVDALIHGKRRWFLMKPKQFMSLRQTASEILEPASAFMFFEQQLEELVDDHSLGDEIPYYDTNQLPGDLIYIPDGLVMTSLNMVDSISYRQHVTPKAETVVEGINSKIWLPESGQVPAGFQFGLCTDLDLDKAGETLGKKVHPQMGAQVTQIMKQFFPDPIARNHLILDTLSDCHAAMAGKVTGTYCPKVWGPCVQQLEKHAKKMKVALPSWLNAAHATTMARLGKLASPKTEL